MRKEILIFLGLIAVAGLALFFDDVLAYFNGMTPLEAIQQIFTFILHVTIGTVCGYVVFGLPAIVKPWVRMLRRNRRHAWRSGPNAQWAKTPRQPTPKLTATLTMPRPTAPRPTQAESTEPTMRLDW